MTQKLRTHSKDNLAHVPFLETAQMQCENRYVTIKKILMGSGDMWYYL